MTADERTLQNKKDALDVVLSHFGPDQLTDGAHAHLCWLRDLVQAALDDDKPKGDL